MTAAEGSGQLQAIKRWCRTHGAELVQVYEDIGNGWCRFEERPAGKQLLADAEAHREQGVEAVVCGWTDLEWSEWMRVRALQLLDDVGLGYHSYCIQPPIGWLGQREGDA